MAEPNVHSFTFEGVKVDYDSKALHSWSVQKKLAAGGVGGYEAVDAILCGKSDDVAAQFDDDADKMIELLTALGALAGGSKN